MNNSFHCTLHWACVYLLILGWKLIHLGQGGGGNVYPSMTKSLSYQWANQWKSIILLNRIWYISVFVFCITYCLHDFHANGYCTGQSISLPDEQCRDLTRSNDLKSQPEERCRAATWHNFIKYQTRSLQNNCVSLVCSKSLRCKIHADIKLWWLSSIQLFLGLPIYIVFNISYAETTELTHRPLGNGVIS